VAEPQRAPEPPAGAAKTAHSRTPANAKTSERGGGWISDLLARVDNDEPRFPKSAGPKPPRKPRNRRNGSKQFLSMSRR